MATRFKKGQSGNPGGKPHWYSALQKEVGDLGPIWEMLHIFALGGRIPRTDHEGNPLRDREGKVRYIEPRGSRDCESAAAMLMDRYLGKPPQQIALGGAGDTVPRRLMPDLSDENRERLLTIAAEQALAAGERLLEEEAGTIEAEYEYDEPETVEDELGIGTDPGTVLPASCQVCSSTFLAPDSEQRLVCLACNHVQSEVEAEILEP